MINDARLAYGKGPIGFVNPTVSSFVSGFVKIASPPLPLLVRSTPPSLLAPSTTLPKAAIPVAILPGSTQPMDGTL